MPNARPQHDSPNPSSPSGSLFSVRSTLSRLRAALAIAACCFLVFAADAQTLRSGTFAPAGGSPATWSINANHTLIWDGQPYLPLGARIVGTVDEVARAKAAGIGDVIVELPASGMSWKPVLEKLEADGMRYLIAVSSAAPACSGIAIEPQSYRIPGITRPTRVEKSIPGAESALIMLVTRGDGLVKQTFRIFTPNGKLAFDVKPPSDLEHVVLVYPQMSSLALVDCWSGMDSHRDALLMALQTNKPGKGLRGILNPVGSAVRLRSSQSFVPTDALFRNELKEHLIAKYKTIETVQRAWGFTVDQSFGSRAAELETFDKLSRLTPLWSGTRGVPYLLDPKTDHTYLCASKLSTIWSDIELVLSQAESRRFRRLASAIRKVCDVPVVQEWIGWASPYESGTAELDGLGATTFGTSTSSLADTAGRAASSILRWGQPGWLLASRVDLGGQEGAAKLGDAIEDLSSVGCRGWFVRAGDAATLQAAAAEAQKRASDASPSQWSPVPVFFPESALNPASIMRLPGGKWWLPGPMEGNRVDLGSKFFAYRIGSGSNSSVALWTSAGAVRIKLLMSDPKGTSFASVDGSDPKPKLVKGGVEVNVSDLPLIMSGTPEIPVPEFSVRETAFRFDFLLREAEGLKLDTSDFRFAFTDALDGLARTPGANYATMKSELDKLAARIGRFTWIEAAKVGETNFSEILQVPGTSRGTALGLRTALSEGSEGYSAEYGFSPKTEEDLEVWIAARIPAELRSHVHMIIGGQELKILEGPISLYGPGFGWYRLGVTRLLRGQTKIKLMVDPANGLEMAVDAILLCPGSFTPNGPLAPDPAAYPEVPEKFKAGGGQ